MKTLLSHPHFLAVFISVTLNTAFALDGIALTCRSTETDPFGFQTGSIVRHILKNDSVTRVDTIYASTDARCACLSPSGKKIAFIRTADGSICTTGVNPGAALGIAGEIGPNAWIEWSAEDRLYFTKYLEYQGIKRLKFETGSVESIGYLPQGMMHFSVSAATDSTLVGTALLHLYGTTYDVDQFNYKGYQIPDSSMHIYGCATSISPDGSLFTVGLCTDTSDYHKKIQVLNWDRTLYAELTAPGDEFWSRTRWSVNSNEWLISTIGAEKELLQYHDAILHTKDLSSSIRLTSNDTGYYDEGCDFWVGDPDSVVDTTGIHFENHFLAHAQSHSLCVASDHLGRTHITVVSTGGYRLDIFAVSGKHLSSVSGFGKHTHVAKALTSGAYIASANYANGSRESVRFFTR